MQEFNYLNLTSLIIAILSFGFALYQTAKLSKIKRVRDINLKDVWKKQKDLSGILIDHDEGSFPRSSCGKKSQDLEHDIAKIIAFLCGWKVKDLNGLQSSSQIDEFDYNYLKRVLDK